MVVEFFGLQGDLGHEAKGRNKVGKLEFLADSVSAGNHLPAAVEERLQLGGAFVGSERGDHSLRACKIGEERDDWAGRAG